MKEIPLTKGYVTLVDDEDFDSLMTRSWSVNITKSGHIYAQYTKRFGSRKENKQTTVQMHRIIKDAKTGEYVDHIDGNTLNNQKSNLRICTNTQNAYNQVGHVNQRKCKYKGVKRSNTKSLRYYAKITVKGKSLYLGSFSTQEDAARAYNEAAINHHGPFAFLNKIEENN